jgi:hypothetical protein
MARRGRAEGTTVPIQIHRCVRTDARAAAASEPAPKPPPHLLHRRRLAVGGLQLLDGDVLALLFGGWLVGWSVGWLVGLFGSVGRSIPLQSVKSGWRADHTRRYQPPRSHQTVPHETRPRAPTWLSLKMFFLRSMILRPPWGVSVPMSPVWNQPSASRAFGFIVCWGGGVSVVGVYSHLTRTDTLASHTRTRVHYKRTIHTPYARAPPPSCRASCSTRQTCRGRAAAPRRPGSRGRSRRSSSLMMG